MIPFVQFGNPTTPALFLHANGYPPECYIPLLNQIGAIAPYQRPLWPQSDPQAIEDWQPLSDDLLQFADEQGQEKIRGVGHSMGATILLRSALQHPDRFERLVLIDPVLFPISIIQRWQAVRGTGKEYESHPLAQAALRRRKQFDDLEKLSAGYRQKEIFRYISDDGLQALVRGLTQPDANNGYELRYSPEWEARIYVTGLWKDTELWENLPNLQTPTLIIRGAESDTFLEKASQKVLELNPRIQVQTIPQSTHLVPLERPAETAALIGEFLPAG